MAVTSVAMAENVVLIIVTATVFAFLARRTGQPTLVAYILAGILLGPIALNLVTETQLVTLLSDLGLGFLLFLIGIEMKFDEIHDIFSPVVRIAIGQTILQTGLAFAISYLLGFTLVETIILALATVFGATPVVVKLLADKDEITTVPGKIDVGVLLIQDIVLIVTLTVLSVPELGSIGHVALRLGEIIMLIGVIALFSMLSSRYILPRLFERIADNDHAFFVYGVAWAFLFISTAMSMDISLEIGAFLAGLSLGQLPYSSEMQERIRPLTDFFMVIFFTAIGLSLTADNLLTYWREAVMASVLLMVGNFLIMFYLIDREKFTPETSFKGSINMTQVSEFSLVVGAMAITQGYIGENILGYLSLMALLTMGASSYLIKYNDELYGRFAHILDRFDRPDKQDIEIDILDGHALIIGYSRLAEEVVPVLRERYDQLVIVDRTPSNAREMRETEHTFIYGDFKHSEIRRAARVEDADIILSFIPDPVLNRTILADADDDALVFVRSDDVTEASDLYDRGASYVMNAKILAASTLSSYIDAYLRDGGTLARPTREDVAGIWWRGER